MRFGELAIRMKRFAFLLSYLYHILKMSYLMNCYCLKNDTIN